MKQSGLFSEFTRPPAELPQPTGIMRRKSEWLVDSELAGNLVEFAIRDVGIESALAGLEFVSSDEPSLDDEIRRYMRDAQKTSRERAVI
jgi:hypothetical protein